MYKGKCSVIIPAHNEEVTIGNCCRQFVGSSRVAQVIVVANACGDMTAARAAEAGALVIETSRKGKGLAIKQGAGLASEEVVVLCDGDLQNPSSAIVDNLLRGMTSDRVVLVKGTFDRQALPGPVTDMLVKPVLRMANHPAQVISQPLSGMVAARRDFLLGLDLPNDFGVDLAMLLSAYEQRGLVTEVQLPPIEHRTRPWSHYQSMSAEVAKVLLRFGLIRTYQEKKKK